MGQYLPKYLPLAMHGYNAFFSTDLNGFNPYEIVFGRKLRMLIYLEPDKISKYQESIRNIMNY